MDKPIVTHPDGELVEHTRLPWYQGRDQTSVWSGPAIHGIMNGFMIARCYGGRETPEEEIYANVALIASISDMAVEITRLRALCKRLSDALLKVRSLGGSELFTRVGEDFYADPEYCGAAIDKLRADLHESRKVEVLRAREAKAEITILKAELAKQEQLMRAQEAETKVSSLKAVCAEMKTALLNVRKIITEAAMTGFNCHDGDWAGRLFASQQITSTALTRTKEAIK